MNKPSLMMLWDARNRALRLGESKETHEADLSYLEGVVNALGWAAGVESFKHPLFAFEGVEE